MHDTCNCVCCDSKPFSLLNAAQFKRLSQPWGKPPEREVLGLREPVIVV